MTFPQILCRIRGDKKNFCRIYQFSAVGHLSKTIGADYLRFGYGLTSYLSHKLVLSEDNLSGCQTLFISCGKSNILHCANLIDVNFAFNS